MTPTLMRELARLTSQAFATPAQQEALLAAARSVDVRSIGDMSQSAQDLIAKLRQKIARRISQSETASAREVFAGCLHCLSDDDDHDEAQCSRRHLTYHQVP